MVQRPTSVSVIAWVYIGFGILGLLGGILGTAASLLMTSTFESAQRPEVSPDDPILFRLMSSMFHYFWLFGVLQLIVAVLMIWSGVAFLRLRAWARTVVETLAWLGLAYNLGFGFLWCMTLVSMTDQMPEEAGAFAAFPIIMLVMGIVMILAFSVPLVVIIRVVRGRTVREAVAGAV